jgi:hypothetical protein
MFKDAGIDPALIYKKKEDEQPGEIDLEAKLVGRTHRRADSGWIIYPEDGAKSAWDVFMTM